MEPTPVEMQSFSKVALRKSLGRCNLELVHIYQVCDAILKKNEGIGKRRWPEGGRLDNYWLTCW